MLNCWIDEENLGPFLETVAGVIGYELHPDEMVALRYGVKDSDAEQGRWSSYEMSGREVVGLRLGQDVGSGVVQVKIECSEALRSGIEMLVHVCQTYRLGERRSSRSSWNSWE